MIFGIFLLIAGTIAVSATVAAFAVIVCVVLDKLTGNDPNE